MFKKEKSTQNLVSDLKAINPELAKLIEKKDFPYLTGREMIELLVVLYPDKTISELIELPEFKGFGFTYNPDTESKDKDKK